MPQSKPRSWRAACRALMTSSMAGWLVMALPPGLAVGGVVHDGPLHDGPEAEAVDRVAGVVADEVALDAAEAGVGRGAEPRHAAVVELAEHGVVGGGAEVAP